MQKIVPLDGALIDLARPPEHTRQYGALSSNPLLKTSENALYCLRLNCLDAVCFMVFSLSPR